MKIKYKVENRPFQYLGGYTQSEWCIIFIESNRPCYDDIGTVRFKNKEDAEDVCQMLNMSEQNSGRIVF